MPACSTLKRHQVDRRVFASSIDLNIELHAVAFVQRLKTRPFYGTDVHECIGLAVIPSDETKALHRIEELDRACRLFAGELALRSCCRLALFHGDHIANNLQIAGRNLATAVHQLKLKLLTFGKAFEAGAFYRADMHEHILAALITLDEAETFGRVEELYSAAALANNLGWHAATTSATAAEATAAARTTAEAATTAAIIAAAAETVATATKAIATTAETVTATETILSGEERVELVLSKPIPLVAAPSATTFIKTHLYERTFAAPLKYSPDAWTNHVRRQKEEPSNSTILSCNRQSYTSRGPMANRITCDFRQTARIWSEVRAVLACLMLELRLFDVS